MVGEGALLAPFKAFTRAETLTDRAGEASPSLALTPMAVDGRDGSDDEIDGENDDVGAGDILANADRDGDDADVRDGDDTPAEA